MLEVEIAEPTITEQQHEQNLVVPVVTDATELEFVAKVRGQPFANLPKDLYIPPDALEVFLEAFEGPLDLLLYLIKKNNLEILDIPIAEITRQYMGYIELLTFLRLELAAEYLLMAAMLAEIKSRLLLPRSKDAEEDEADPRSELVRRLQEYERFKQAAEKLDTLPRMGRDIFQASAEPPEIEIKRPVPQVELQELLHAFMEVMKRAEMLAHHHVQREPMSVRERMSHILSTVTANSFTAFTSLFTLAEGRMGVVVTFIAILELIRESLLELVQAEPFGPIHIRAVS